MVSRLFCSFAVLAFINKSFIIPMSAEHIHAPLKDIIIRDENIDYKIPFEIQNEPVILNEPEIKMENNQMDERSWVDMINSPIQNSVISQMQKDKQSRAINWNRHNNPDIDNSPSYEESPWLKYAEKANKWIHGGRDIEIAAMNYIPICRVERNLISLENCKDYEYRPAFYEEVRCLRSEYEMPKNNICTRLGFSCVEWNKTIHITRRLFTSTCWETLHRNVTTCECMWPEHKLGTMRNHIELK